MYVVTLTFSDNKDKAPDFMEGHKSWIQKGFEAGLFLLVGGLEGGQGGGILAQAQDRGDLEAFVKKDPFVAENVVSAQITGITPSKVDERLNFLAS